ncbi:MAG: hypothetical protein KME07_06410 [Pegethrix bostrychoides GSE-TBD4-15B]|jgi:hypothetical protein|uniref:Uncharacterized protein n=1 Tax=Pegethrix bostrychoides GSE-TBD4-15B TaxID=2839662 RepID=A0A951P985_9CYAN|nr:hypothetical protein [Pegethrix bostrychoides GSE-TBD4-15B]
MQELLFISDDSCHLNHLWVMSGFSKALRKALERKVTRCYRISSNDRKDEAIGFVVHLSSHEDLCLGLVDEIIKMLRSELRQQTVVSVLFVNSPGCSDPVWSRGSKKWLPHEI